MKARLLDGDGEPLTEFVTCEMHRHHVVGRSIDFSWTIPLGVLVATLGRVGRDEIEQMELEMDERPL